MLLVERMCVNCALIVERVYVRLVLLVECVDMAYDVLVCNILLALFYIL